MTPKEKALESFRKPPLRLNCAQAVAHGFGRDDLLEKFAACGNGRAPGGLCGALFCATELAGRERAAEVAAEFVARTGGRECFKIKGECRTPCPDCVAAAADILAEKLNRA